MYTDTHTLPGFFSRSPLHIMVVVLHIDQPFSEYGCGVINVVICCHPVDSNKHLFKCIFKFS